MGRTPVEGEIEFRGVAVKYPAGDALRRVDLRIPAGATVAIVGHTGSGKSTLVSLIPRLLDPTAWRGLSGRARSARSRSRMAAPADRLRAAGDVPVQRHAGREHRVGRGERDRKSRSSGLRNWRALAPDIAGFPNGYDTMVGERGITLSGGQKQRTAIARAILRNPRILILDDALASVDTLTEERILNGLAEVMRGRTTILISHRVSTVRNAERIFVLEHGEVAEEGSHAELVLNGGYYADLYQKQLLEEELESA